MLRKVLGNLLDSNTDTDDEFDLACVTTKPSNPRHIPKTSIVNQNAEKAALACKILKLENYIEYYTSTAIIYVKAPKNAKTKTQQRLMETLPKCSVSVTDMTWDSKNRTFAIVLN